MQQSEKQRRIDELTQQLGRILHEMAELEPPDIVTLVLALPVDLAGYMSDLAQRKGLELPHIYSSFALHGAVHGAWENGEATDAQRLLAIVRRLAPPDEWRRFVAQHPEVQPHG